MRIDFQTWFKQQPFYEKLIFVHGDRLFDFDTSEDSYRVMPVQVAWVTWAHLHESLTAVECNCDCGECENG